MFLLLLASPGFAQKNMILRANYQYPVKSSSLWGYTAPNGKEYALMGLETGVSIVDISNPDNPIELYNIQCPQSQWREIKTWNHHAYITNETDSGILIIDLNFLPDSISTQYWKGNNTIETAHTLFIDENGILYVNGFNLANDLRPVELRGTLMADLTIDPKNPVIVGIYEQGYVHDCFARGDTLWTAEIYNGWFSVIDITNKSAPVILNTQTTPDRFTHNCWLSDDGKYLFTTDEVAGGNITSYDVSDLSNIRELDRYRSSFQSGIIPHNTHVLGHYLINSCYKDGVTIVDISRPENMVEVGRYDTSPFPSEDGFAGCWGVYPYFPSGTIIASDMEEGLFILTPTYTRACYLEGQVTQSPHNTPLAGVRVEIIGHDWYEFSDIAGTYKTGIADSGRYDIRFFMPGCTTKIIKDVTLAPGTVTELHVSMECFSSPVFDVDYSKHFFILRPSVFTQYTTLYYELSGINSPHTFLLVTDAYGRQTEHITLNENSGVMLLGQSYTPGMYYITLQTPYYLQTLKSVKIN